MNQDEWVQDEWIQAVNSFRLKIPCPHCSKPVQSPTASQLSRCPHCGGLFEWTKHHGDQGNTTVFWPRKNDDNFSSLDGRRYQHASLFDFSEIGGHCGKTSGILEPDLALYDAPNSDYAFQLNRITPLIDNDSSNREHIQFIQDTKPHSLLVMHGRLVVACNDGSIVVFDNIMGDWSKFTSQTYDSIFEEKRIHDRFHYLPCGNFPYIFITNERQCVIWKMNFSTEQEESYCFDLPEKMVHDGFFMIGSPTSFYYEQQLIFACTFISDDVSKGTYIFAFVQEKDHVRTTKQSPFRMVVLFSAYLFNQAVLFLTSRKSIVSLCLNGKRLMEYEVEKILNQPAFDHDSPSTTTHKISRDSYRSSGIGSYQIDFNPNHNMMIQQNNKKKYLVFVFKDNNDGASYVSRLPISKLSTPMWTTKRINVNLNEKVKNVSISSCYGFLRKGEKLLNTLVLTTANNIWLIDFNTGNPIGERIADKTLTHKPLHVDSSIITNAGVVSRIGSQIYLSWDMLDWNTPIENNVVSTQKRTSLTLHGSPSESGLVILNNRIFTISYAYSEKASKKNIYELCVIDIEKTHREQSSRKKRESL